jgi:prephenate dehydratase
MKIVIQGQNGSYHHQAAQQFFGKEFELVGEDTFKDAFAVLVESKADAGVIAIENSLFGSINSVYDLLLQHKLWIIGEVYLRIEHCLIGTPDSSLDDIREVYTQLEAMAQCEAYLDNNLPDADRHEHHDTAASVADIKKWGNRTKAAIASEDAAKLHGMKVLQKGIEDNKQNYTRFVVLSSTKKSVQDANKTSLVLTTKSDTKPGALYAALGAFANRDINLSMLQSRPLVGKAWHYLFYLDVDAGEENEDFKTALQELETIGFDITVLGSYQSGR